MRLIHITDNDLERLRELIHVGRHCGELDQTGLKGLEDELEQASVVPCQAMRQDVVTMHSQARIQNLESGEEMVFTLVYPRAADLEQGKISVLSPLGTAILGYQAGDIIHWRVPDGVRRLKIVQVEYQPEAAGDFHL
jgi:regulator of nucleoside diphosphate kinase